MSAIEWATPRSNEIEWADDNKKKKDDASSKFNRDAVSLPLVGVELLGSIPGAVTAGITGLAEQIGSAGETDMALKMAQEVMHTLTPSQMVRNTGSILKNLGANQVGGALEGAVDQFRESTPHKLLIEAPFGTLVHAARDVGSVAAKAAGVTDYDTLEKAGNIGELALYNLGLGLAGKRGTKPSAADLEAARKARQDSKGQPPSPPTEYAPTQLELPLEAGFRPGEGPLPVSPTSVPLRDMRQHVQGDLFDPNPPANLWPGNRRAEEMRQQRLPYEDARLAPELQEGLYDQMRENTRITEMRGERPTIDFPLRQEAYERDPYPYTLKEEYERHVKNGDEAKAQEVLAEAERYAREQYGMSVPDKFTGSLWADKPTALPIEKTTRPDLGVPPTAGRNRGPFEKSQSLNRGKFRQAGTVEFPGGNKKLGDSPDARFWRLLVKQFETEPELKTAFSTDRELLALNNEEFAAVVMDRAVDRYVQNETFRRLRNRQGGVDEFGRIQDGTLYDQIKNEVMDDFIRGEVPMKLILGQLKETLVDRRAGLFTRADVKGEATPLAGFTNKGTFKQGGSINFSPKDPEFLKFKDALPEHLKSQAKDLYKQILKEEAKEAQRAPEVYKGENQLKVLEGVPGLKDWKDTFVPIDLPVAQVKELALKEQDPKVLSNPLRDVIPGGKILGAGTKDTMIRWSVHKLDTAFREAFSKINDLILDKKSGYRMAWESLSADEQASAHATILAHEGVKDLSRAELFDLGLSEKEVNAIERYRQVDDQVFALINEARVAIGKEPLERRPGHFPSRFRGDFIVEVKDADGTVVHRIGDATKDGAERAAAFIKERAPEYTYSEVKHEPLHRIKDSSDAQAGYQSLIKMLADEDPRVQALESVYAEYLQKEAYKTLGVRKHFWDKRGVKGFEGGKEWKSAIENAQEGQKSFMNYVDHAVKWAEVVKVMKDLKELLKDADIQKARPETVKWIETYVDNALGRSTRIARFIDNLSSEVIAKTGIGHSLQIKTVREAKKAAMALTLGLGNFAFSATQLAQVIQAVPPMLLNLQAHGAQVNMPLAMAKGTMEGFMGYTFGREKLSQVGKEAWEFAKKYGIVEPRFLEDLRSITDKTSHTITDMIVWGSMRWPEKIARTQAYMTYVHFLHDAGLKGEQLYKTAADLTDITMVDYRPQERSMLYPQLGTILGEMANAMTSYKHNQLGQMWMYQQQGKSQIPVTMDGKTGKPDNNRSVGYLPLAAFIGMLGIFTGLIGLPGREDIDTYVIKPINATNILNHPMWDTAAGKALNPPLAAYKYFNPDEPVRIPTIRELMLRIPSFVGFGPASALTGWDWSRKFGGGQYVPDSLFVMDFWGGAMESIANIASDPSMTTVMGEVSRTGPGWLRSIGESYLERNGMAQDPRKLQGMYRRGPSDRVARFTGTYSLGESKARHADRAIEERNEFLEHHRGSLIKKAKRALFAGNTEQLKDLAMKFVQAEGTPQQFTQALLENAKGQHLDVLTRRLIESMNNARKANRIMEEVERAK